MPSYGIIKLMLKLNLPQSQYRQEEQKWLDALEKGELDDFGRVKQDKDVSMMTARQVQYDSYQLQNAHLCFSSIIPLVKRRKCCLIHLSPMSKIVLLDIKAMPVGMF